MKQVSPAKDERGFFSYTPKTLYPCSLFQVRRKEDLFDTKLARGSMVSKFWNSLLINVLIQNLKSTHWYDLFVPFVASGNRHCSDPRLF
jgi:hypothetical protein